LSFLRSKIGKYKTSPENEGKKQGYAIGKNPRETRENYIKHDALQKHTEIFQPKFLGIDVPRGTIPSILKNLVHSILCST
jgi:hypothetical protein